MSRLYRVFPYVASANPEEPGGAVYRAPGGKNRADAPDGSYRCLYAGDTPEGCIAEYFGRFDTWDRHLIEAAPATPMLPNSRFALVSFELPDDVGLCDLDDARTLLAQNLRPSDVVTRNRDVSQAWSWRIHESGIYGGVRWWSYYDPIWHSYAVWDLSHLTIVDAPSLLRVDDAFVERAAATIVRRLLVA